MTRFFSGRWPALALNLIGLVLVAISLAQNPPDETPRPIAVVAWAVWALWAVATLLPERLIKTRTSMYVVLVAGGALVAGATNVVGFVPGAIGLVVLGGTPAVSRLLVAAAVTGAAILMVGTAWLEPASRDALVGSLSALSICTLAGLSRRQHRVSEEQTRALFEERLAVAALTERSRIARDLHDVLAHSLGGLVIQLEAVDALLEKGRSDEARVRVVDARRLAVSGLDEAKQAVTALREPPATLVDLVDAHRALGGEVTVRGRAEDGTLTAEGRVALHRAVQELLTNARRHAPGAPATLDLDWGKNALTVTASTPLAAAPTHSGGGHGLTGMRERVVQAGGTMTVRPGPPFAVEISLPRERGRS